MLKGGHCLMLLACIARLGTIYPLIIGQMYRSSDSRSWVILKWWFIFLGSSRWKGILRPRSWLKLRIKQTKRRSCFWSETILVKCRVITEGPKKNPFVFGKVFPNVWTNPPTLATQPRVFVRFGTTKGEIRVKKAIFGVIWGSLDLVWDLPLLNKKKTKGSNDYSISGGEGVSGPGEEAEDGWGYKSKTGRAFNLGKGSLFWSIAIF